MVVGQLGRIVATPWARCGAQQRAARGSPSIGGTSASRSARRDDAFGEVVDGDELRRAVWTARSPRVCRKSRATLPFGLPHHGPLRAARLGEVAGPSSGPRSATSREDARRGSPGPPRSQLRRAGHFRVASSAGGAAAATPRPTCRTRRGSTPRTARATATATRRGRARSWAPMRDQNGSSWARARTLTESSCTMSRRVDDPAQVADVAPHRRVRAAAGRSPARSARGGERRRGRGCARAAHASCAAAGSPRRLAAFSLRASGPGRDGLPCARRPVGPLAVSRTRSRSSERGSRWRPSASRPSCASTPAATPRCRPTAPPSARSSPAWSPQHPAIEDSLFDGGKLRGFINVYVDDEDVRYLDGLDSTVDPDGPRSRSCPPVAGGAG